MSEDSARIRILCVDDHTIVRQRIAGLLAAARGVPGFGEQAALAGA